MLKNLLTLSLLSLTPITLLACSNNSVESPTREGPAISQAIPVDSPFAKIRPGMPMDEVYATIGPPTSPATTYVTPKNNIPFHYGPDNYRTVAHYKGLGSITFSQNDSFSTAASVLFIDFNPNDPGFRQK